MTATFYVGDSITVMNTLPEKSVDLILTSPPFLALRSYLPPDHPDKALEGGSQATPGEYIDWLLDVVEACTRVLAPHGSLCFELGDTYSGSTNVGGEEAQLAQGNGQQSSVGTWRTSQPIQHRGDAVSGASQGWPLAKSLSLIPETFRFAMVYGVNPHTGRQTAPWRLRNVIRWVRPNPPVGALGDKFRPATSELMVFCKSKDRYFDLDAVREPSVNPIGVGVRPTQARVSGHDINDHRDKLGPFTRDMQMAGAPPLDWWNIPPGGYPGAHYAVWPPELLIKPIKAMSPERVCRTCGEASRRIVEAESIKLDGSPVSKDEASRSHHADDIDHGYSPATWTGGNTKLRRVLAESFSDCLHDDYRPGIVLDPFAGSGTTLSVATGHGRDAIGIDLDERNYELSLDRVGPLILQRGEIRDGTGPPD